MADAEKRLTTSSFSDSFSSTASKFEEVAEMYSRAANLFKMAKKWDDAAEAFSKCGDMYLKLQNKFEAAGCFINAGNCIKKTNVGENIRLIKKAIELYAEEGRFTMCARYQKELAELCEAELDLKGAIENYKCAADFYEGEGSSTTANTCLLKVALFSAQLENYDEGIQIYERIASSSIDNNMLKWSVKDYLFRAAMCHLCVGDIVAVQRALQRYADLDVTFATSREGELLKELTEALDANDKEKFTTAVVNFNSISPLDPWKTTMLLRVKNLIKEEAESLT